MRRTRCPGYRRESVAAEAGSPPGLNYASRTPESGNASDQHAMCCKILITNHLTARLGRMGLEVMPSNIQVRRDADKSLLLLMGLDYQSSLSASLRLTQGDLARLCSRHSSTSRQQTSLLVWSTALWRSASRYTGRPEGSLPDARLLRLLRQGPADGRTFSLRSWHSPRPGVGSRRSPANA